jgi:hypothetical protein
MMIKLPIQNARKEGTEYVYSTMYSPEKLSRFEPQGREKTQTPQISLGVRTYCIARNGEQISVQPS